MRAIQSMQSAFVFLVCAVLTHNPGFTNSHAVIKEESSPLRESRILFKNSLKSPEGYELFSEDNTTTTTTAEATFNTNDILLVAPEHQNATVVLFVRGELTECINITFTYSPANPSIQPIDDIGLLCPDNKTRNDDRNYILPYIQLQNEHQEHHSNWKIFRAPFGHGWNFKDRLLRAKTKGGIEIRDADVKLAASSQLLLNRSIDIISRWVGNTNINVHASPPLVDVNRAFIRVSVIHSKAINVVSDIFGWIYSIVWDVSFLPQVWLNWRRKSVIGFSFDNVALNIVAYLYYALFNVALFAMPLIKDQFEDRYPMRVNHVKPNDIFFSVYALTIEIILGIQCFIYERAKGQRVSNPCRILVIASIICVIIACILVPAKVLWWLDVFYLMSYLKLVITPLKYIPQLYVNYQLKSTEGFSMVGLLMDFTGGVMSLAQMFMLAGNSNDWLSIFTDFSKFGLGVLTIMFDVFFFIQHCHYHCRCNRGE